MRRSIERLNPLSASPESVTPFLALLAIILISAGIFIPRLISTLRRKP